METIKTKGKLIKTKAIDPENYDINMDDFFKKIIENQYSIEDVILEWDDQFSDKDLIILPVNNFKSQINIMEKDIPIIHSVIIDKEREYFIVLKIIEELEVNDLKNMTELSGEGKLITPFMISFKNYSKTYLKDKDNSFFNLEKDNIIINDIILVSDGSPKFKLTGRAAELAKRKGKQ